MIRAHHIASIIIALGLGASWPLQAQNETDALKLSQREITGSARAVAMGGAFTSLGGDMTGIALNPAGLGVLRSNQFTITPSFHTNITNTQYYGTGHLSSSSDFNISTLGIYGVKDIRRNGKWRSIAFGFGLNRNMSYHRQYTIKHNAVPSSLINAYVRTLNVNGIQPQQLNIDDNPAYPFDIALAWNNCLIDEPGGGCLLRDETREGGYVNAVGELPINQQQVVEESGSQRNSMLSFAGNWDDKLYIGVSAEFSRIGYERNYIHTEVMDPNDTLAIAERHSFEYAESIEGMGVALNTGIIYRPLPLLRIGWSFITPTVYGLEIEYESYSSAVFPEGTYETPSPYIGRYDFRLTSPLRSNLGASLVLGKVGLVSVDAEYVDFRMMRMQGISDNYAFGREEDAIRTELQPTVNLRAGAEFRVSPLVSLRAGYAHFSNPYRNDRNPGGFDTYSLGGGYQSDSYFIDLAYQYKVQSERRFLYDESLVNAAEMELIDHRFFLTFGYRF